MAAPRGRGPRSGGVVRAMWRLLVLVAVGFGVGLLFGIVTEEPELLANHLRGESEFVSLDSDGPAQTTPREILDSEGGTPASAAGGAAAPTPTRSGDPSAQTDAAARRPVVASARAASPAAARPATGGTSIPVARPAAAPESALQGSRAESSWSIQVGAFSEQAAANQLAEGLRARYPVEVLAATGKGGRWRVRVQPIKSEEQARQMAEKLKRDERLPTWVTPMEGRSGS